MMSDLQHYWSLLESTQQQQCPEFLEHLRGQIGEEGRAAVIQFQDGTKPSVKNLRNSRALERFLNIAQPTGSVRRRIFVLEGLPRNFIQVLGAKLRVPLAFFASHWAGPGRFIGSLLNRTPRHYDNQNRFILTFTTLHRARINALKEDDSYPFYYMESSTHRYLSRMTIFGDLDGPLCSLEQLSFWSTSNAESWDAIPLVDPPLGKFVKWMDSRIPERLTVTFL
ncbi:hypothetical protein L207DRAFT_627816 [Hyaloscypha variabilis F]|uniref:Uncharacterized protein n=1 Tax=Hyaloscypha variabilis (strain UAMH 11265 / GT02V1 / F) TaxID=1149755 RepID=A0A2J6S8K7_HYAVF|nr:hypothetical protein L207DRAFT_627816 [Hyaloscypha variabilis F]